MVEQNADIRKFSMMSPDLLNIELGVLYDFLPGFEFPDVLEDESILIDSDELQERIEAFSDRVEQRENSELKQSLVQRYRKLIAFAQTTEPCKDFLAFEYEELFSYGIEKNTSQGLFNNEYEHWQRLLQWRQHDFGGIFDKKQAPEIERKLLREFQKNQLRTKFVFETALESDDFQMLLDQIIAGVREDDAVRRMLMTDEEQEEYKKRLEKEMKEARRLIDKEAYTDSLLRRWHSAYLTKYGD